MISKILFLTAASLFGCKAPIVNQTSDSRALPNVTGQPYGSDNVQPYSNSPAPVINSSPSPSASTDLSQTTLVTPVTIPEPSPESTAAAEEVDSGLIRFLATGIIRSRAGSTNITQDMTANVTSDLVKFDVKSFRATDGDREDQVDEEVSKKIGAVQYFRTPRQQLDAQSGAAFKVLRDFIVFADRSDDRRGVKSNEASKLAKFVSPFPVLIIPGPQSRYSGLAAGRQVLNTVVNVGTRSIAVETRVFLGVASGDITNIVIENYIAADKAGELYQLIPVAKRTEFAVDTNLKRIAAIKSVTDYNDEDDDDERYDITFTHELCSILKNGVTELFGKCKNPQ